MTQRQMVRVLFNYTYTPKDGSNAVNFTNGEEYILYKRTNHEWWSVYKAGSKPVFVPANYVEVISTKTTKKVPPKPVPKVPPKPPKPLEPDSVLKDLDDMLDTVIAEAEMDEYIKDDDASSREDVSMRGSTPDGELSSNPMASSSDSLDIDHHHSRPNSARSLQDDLYANSQVFLESKAQEEPMYANLQEVKSARVPPPRPPQPKKRSSSPDEIVMAVSQDSDEDDPGHDYANIAQLVAQQMPPCPPPGSIPTKLVNSEWAMYTGDGGRPYYYNSTSGVSAWRPPNSPGNNEGALPVGWLENRPNDGELFFTNEYNTERWYRSSDEGGQVYYYKEGTSESSWDLPESPGVAKEEESGTAGNVFHSLERGASTHGGHQPRIREMQTIMNKTKIAEQNKRLKKNWSQSYVITTGHYVYFYKDQKMALPKPDFPVGKPEGFIDLRAAKVEKAPKEYSSKKNVILISAFDGTQYLLQSDDKSRMLDWQATLKANISLLGGVEPAVNQTVRHSWLPGHSKNDATLSSKRHSAYIQPPPSPKSSKNRKPIKKGGTLERPQPPASPKFSKTKKPTKKGGTLERPTTPEDTVSGAEKNTKIKDWLLYWLLRRPTAESLKDRGIIKDGLFGSHLQSICDREKVLVPRFVINCITAVETRGLNMSGIYRVSGNMANVQKMRFLVDQNEIYDLLNPEVDIHDITGALKLFFRELQEPLFPFTLYDKFTKSSQILNRSLKLKAFQDTMKELPKVNFCTMRQLFGHLKKVVEHSRENRMEAQNVAIVFGPTLMRPTEEGLNMAANLVMQGQIIEYMLNEYSSIF